ncbi:MAG: hypothetical protein DMG57_17160 [Acidobacteria bacterium]|nr:MAG: hypothetical protein DMG57_17160 [Acidobacteriota bacterium]
MGIAEADSAEHGSPSKELLITPVACPMPDRSAGDPKLSGRSSVRIERGSRLARLYGLANGSSPCTGEIEEEYCCNYEVNPDYRREFEQAGLSITATGDTGEVRAIEIPGHRFYIATLFQPQLSSTHETPHPIVLGFLARLRSRPRRRRLIKLRPWL